MSALVEDQARAAIGLSPAGRAERRVRRGLRCLLGLVLLVALTGGAWWAGSHTESAAREQALAAPPQKVPLTAPVVRRVLSNTIVVTGVVSPSATFPIGADTTEVPGAEPTVTGLPLGVGAKVRNGTQVLEVAGRPLFVFKGAVPMYRDLVSGDSGKDVKELQAALAALGYSVSSSGKLDSATLAAMAAFYAKAGYSMMSTAPSASPSSETGGASAGAAGGKAQRVIPLTEVAFVPDLPATISALSVAVGSRVTPDALTLAAGPAVVDASLPSGAIGEAFSGEAATVALDSGQVGGHVASVSESLPSSASGTTGTTGTGTSTSHATVALSSHSGLSDLGEVVSVTITLSQSRGPVTAVPVAAVFAKADGQAYVTTVPSGAAPSRKGEKDIMVTTGFAASGYIAVVTSRGSLAPGQSVVIGIQQSGG